MLVRGFPVDELAPDDIELAYVGLGLQLGTPVSQDAEGTTLGHVRDRGRARTGPEVRLYATTQRQDFHTDGADVIGLLCLQGAKRGGESRIVSSAAVYNEILARDPRLLEVLYEPMCWDRNDEQSPGEAPFFRLPVLHDVRRDSAILLHRLVHPRRAAPSARCRASTTISAPAMDLIETIANDPEFYVEMDFQPGDLQLLNNSVILHSARPTTTTRSPSASATCLRLWLQRVRLRRRRGRSAGRNPEAGLGRRRDRRTDDRPGSCARRASAEAVGTALLVAIVIGSGIAAQRLSPGDVGLQLLENSTATGAGPGRADPRARPGIGRPLQSGGDARRPGARRRPSTRDAGVYIGRPNGRRMSQARSSPT